MRVSFSVESWGAEEWLLRWQERVRRRRGEVTREIAARVLERVVQGNPVDTGRSRAAWVSGGEAAGLSVSSGGGNDAAAIGEGAKLGNGRWQEEDTVSSLTVENEVDYVPILEYGSSRQTARAMVRGGIESSRAEARELLRQLITG